MRLSHSAPLFIGLALTEPLGRLQERQLDPSQSSCSASHTAQCTAGLLTSARNFCSSLGFGTAVNTASTVKTLRRTIISTFTVYNATSTVVATNTRTISSSSVTTILTTSVSTFMTTNTVATITQRITGTVPSCSPYYPSLSQSTSVIMDGTDSVSTPTSTSTPTTTSPPTTTPTTTSATEIGLPARSTWSGSACENAYSTAYTFDGTASAYAVCPTAFFRPRGVSFGTVNGLEGCASHCTASNCIGFNYVNSDNCNIIIGDPTEIVTVAPWTAYKFLSAYPAPSTSPPPGPITTTTPVVTPIPTSAGSDSSSFRLAERGCPSPATTTFYVSNTAYKYELCSTAYLEPDSVNINTHGDLNGCAALCTGNCRAFNYANTYNCRTATVVPTNLRRTGYNGASLDAWTAYNLIGSTAGVDGPVFGRSEPTAAAHPLEDRQATLAKPSCLRASAPPLTTSACNCLIPSSTFTRSTTITSTTTSIRTIPTTKTTVSTVTSTPTVTSITIRTTSITRTRTTTSIIRTTATTSTTVSWKLAATPSAFYIADANMAFAEWPADADEIFYHVQYDADQSDDEYAPTTFTLGGANANALTVADVVDDAGSAADGYFVVGQTYNGPGYQILALDQSKGMPRTTCRIEAAADGTCPLRCAIGNNTVNVRNSDGLWSLVPPDAAGNTGFLNFALAADGADLS